MDYRIIEARTDKEWEQGCAVLKRVYVDEGYTDAERAAQVQNRECMEPQGIFLLAVRNPDEEVVGATLYLNEDSALKQLAMPGEREFRMLAVHPDARGAGVGEALVRACMLRAAEDDAIGLVLWTQPTMLSAQRLYERLRFERDAARDVLDPRGFARLVYVWRS